MTLRPKPTFFALLLSLCSGLLFAADVTVDTFTDESDGSCVDGDCSLRDAIDTAAPGDRILVPAGTFILTLGSLEPSVSMDIVGVDAQQTIISGDDSSGVFQINNGPLDIVIEALTITDGTAARGGGVAVRQANLTMRDCIVQLSSGFNGGGIAVDEGGSLTMQGCSVLDNLADGNSGGGILVSSSTLLLLDSTVSGNSAPASGRVGGGIAVFGGSRGGGSVSSVVIRNSTIVANDAEAFGGGIFIGTGGSDVAVSNSVIADNSAVDCNTPITSLGWNVDSDNSCGLGATGDQPSTSPNLAALSLNGATTPNYLPNPGSPLIDSGNAAAADGSDATCTLVDQRGLFIAAGDRCDIGSVESDGVVDRPTLLPEVRPVPTLNMFSLILLGLVLTAVGLQVIRR